MTQNKLVIYPVIFSKDNDGNKIDINVPDINQVTFGDNLNNAVEEAQDLIRTYLDGVTEYPKPSRLKDISLKDDEAVALIPVDMPNYPADDKTVSRMVTIPTYLNEQAKKNNLDLSQVLTAALQERL